MGVNNTLNSVKIDENLLANILTRLSNLEKKDMPKSDLSGQYLTPKQVCEILNIGRSKFYSWVADGYLTPIKPDPKGRKSYILKSQISAMFPKQVEFQ